MATCKECLHWDKCSKANGRTRYYGEITAAGNAEILCEWFIPTADVAEVVRCKDCKYWGSGILTSTEDKDCKRCKHPNLYSEGFCDDFWLETLPDSFCSYGEREE